MDDLRQELAELRAIVGEQQREISELKSRIAGEAESYLAGGYPTRRGLLAGVAAAIAGGAALTPGSSAQAANGQALIVGSYNNNETLPCALTYAGPAAGNNGKIYGFGVVDRTLDRFTFPAGIAGHTAGSFEAGVLGEDGSVAPGKVGVVGMSDYGNGVSGVSGNTGVFARGRLRGLNAVAYGNGPTCIALYAGPDTSAGGGRETTSLLVDGVLRAKRAGRAVVSAGARSKVVSLTALTGTSLVLATAQKLTGTVAVQAVTVKTTSPTTFTITLNAPAPSGGLPVAWVVIDTIGTALS